MQFSKAYTEGISKIEGEDVSFAEQLGFRIKHLGIARKTEAGIELRVHPTLIPEKRLIANVDGVMNAILVKADAVGSTMYYGPGAGAEATASSIIADICDLARLLDADSTQRVPALGFLPGMLDEVPVLPIEQVRTAYYVRLVAEDKPGVIQSISRILAEHGVSIESMLQKAPEENTDLASLALITNVMPESVLQDAVISIESLDAVSGKVKYIRVENLA